MSHLFKERVRNFPEERSKFNFMPLKLKKGILNQYFSYSFHLFDYTVGRQELTTSFSFTWECLIFYKTTDRKLKYTTKRTKLAFKKVVFPLYMYRSVYSIPE